MRIFDPRQIARVGEEVAVNRQMTAALEALDRGMTADEGALMTGSRAGPVLRTAVLDLAAAEV